MLFRKMLRTAWRYKAQFLSMILMIGIGMASFIGFNMEWTSIEKSVNTYFASCRFADYRVYSYASTGFTLEEYQKVEDCDSSFKDNVSRVMQTTGNLVTDDDSTKSLSIMVVENYNVSQMNKITADEYLESDGIFLSDKFAKANDIEIGDEITINASGLTVSAPVTNLVKAAEYFICVDDDAGQMMPDYTSFGFCYISPKLYASVCATRGISPVYPRIDVLSSMAKKDFVSKVEEALGETLLVVEKNDVTSYTEAMGEADEGKTMGLFLPIIFLAIGVLTMVTTMQRIVSSEKSQIGILKALGFHNRRILFHYSAYGGFIGIVGSVLGFLLGWGLDAIVMNPNGMMGTYFDSPVWVTNIPWFVYLGIVLAVVLLMFFSFLSIRHVLKGTAAETLRPTTPKKMRNLLLEKTRLWKKMSFGTKWNIRDAVRHPTRTGVTIFGVFGCVLLLTAGMGMKDTMNNYLSVIKKDMKYENKVTLIEGTDYQAALSYADELEGDWSSDNAVQIGDESCVFSIYSLDHEMMLFRNMNEKKFAPGNEGVYLCKRLKGSYHVGDDYTFSFYGSKDKITVKVAGFYMSSTKGFMATKEYMEKELPSVTYSISSIYTNAAKSEIDGNALVSGIQNRQDLLKTFDNFMEIMNTSIAIIVVLAAVLCVVVLYNLGLMSQVERYREFATLKVVGFRDRSISRMLIAQNLALTAIGIVIGLPFGYLTLDILMKMLASEYEVAAVVGVFSYLIAVVLTIAFSAFVAFLVSRKNKKIDMVGALKSEE